MSNKNIDDEDLRRMINAAVSGTLSDQEWRQLDDVLCSDDNAVAVYLNYCQLEVDLFFRNRALLAGQRMLSQIDWSEIETQQSEIQRASFSSSDRSADRQFRIVNARWSTIITAAAVAFVVTACALSWVSGWRLGRAALQQSLADAPSTIPVPAAYLTMANGCSWDDGLTPIAHQVGSAVQAGNELTLQEGIAEFRLSSGVLLSVEGPASLVITSPTSLVLQHGKLTASVPWRVKDFRLHAGACRVTACDAEFGVIAAEGQLEVHAFAGEAWLTPSLFSEGAPLAGDLADDAVASDDAEAELLVVVEEGRAAKLLAAGDVQKNGPANRNQFATKLSMGGRLPATQEYVNAVLDSHPVSYWRFESIDGGEVLNEVEGAQPLKVVDNVALSGDTRNHSLELGNMESGGHLISDMPVPLSGTDYTLEIWCKPSHFHRGTLVAMGFEDDQKPLPEVLHHAFILQTMRNDGKLEKSLPGSIPGTIRFLHRNPPTHNPRTGTGCYSGSLYQLRRWQHVVAVKEKAAMRLYIDGVLVGRAKDPTEIVQGLRLMIGEAFFRRPELQTPRAFFGQLDELAIYDRALSENEIVEHCQTIRFAPPDLPSEDGIRGKAAHGARVDFEQGNSTAYTTPPSNRGSEFVY